MDYERGYERGLFHARSKCAADLIKAFLTARFGSWADYHNREEFFRGYDDGRARASFEKNLPAIKRQQKAFDRD